MGVGAAAPAMAKLRDHGLIDCLRGLQQPVLGICVGMQLLFERLRRGDALASACFPAASEALPQWRRSDGAAYGLEPGASCSSQDSAVAGGHQERRLGLLRQQLLRAAAQMRRSHDTDYGVPDRGRRPARNVYGCQFHPEGSSDSWKSRSWRTF